MARSKGNPNKDGEINQSIVRWPLKKFPEHFEEGLDDKNVICVFAKETDSFEWICKEGTTPYYKMYNYRLSSRV